MLIRNRIKELRFVAASDLRPNPKNWRKHPKQQQDALRGILAEIGFADACLARELGDGSLMLIDGHLRAETALDAQVPVLILDVSESEADQILVKDLTEKQDSLAQLVWPDYIIDPLLSADWTPPQEDNSPPYESDSKVARVVHFTEDQWTRINTVAEAKDLADFLTMLCVEYAARQ
jgi:hypothetical protein